MFGSSFGRNTSTFGQSSTFGKPATGFSTPTFGSTGTSSLFGQTTQASTNLFGGTQTTPSFGQTGTTPSFGGFGTNTSSSLFSGQQSSSGITGNLFGGTQNTNTASAGLFGSSGTSFGQTQNTGFGFGTGTSANLFGQSQPAQSSIFGQSSSTGAGLFGSTTNSFGANTSGTTIKFNPLSGTDTIVKNGTTTTISTKHNCITCMKEYDNKSIEELRYEDYVANRKGPQSTTQPGTGLFGGAGSSLFGNNPATTTASSGIFGSTGFGQSTSVFGQPSGALQSGGLFGKSSTAVTPFGSTTTTPSTGFGTFNQPSTGLFGANATQNKSAFGGTQTSSGGLFGSSTTGTTGFGTPQTSFGFGNQPSTQSGGLFQQNKFPFGAPSTSAFSFGTNTATSGSNTLFGQKPMGSGFGITTTTSAPSFGTNTFGATTQPSLFNSSFNKPPTGTFNFGQTNTSGIGAGSSIFGNTATKPSSLFGNTTGNTFGTTGGFGTGTPSFGTGTGSTFGNIGGLGTTYGGNVGTALNQPAGQPGIYEQLQMLTAMPFGDAPLFKRILTSSKKEEPKTTIKSPEIINTMNNSGKTNYRVTTKVNNVIRRIPLGPKENSKKSLFDGNNEVSEKDLFVQKLNPRHLNVKPNLLKNNDNVTNVINESILKKPTTPEKMEENYVNNIISSSFSENKNVTMNDCTTQSVDEKIAMEALLLSPRSNSTPLKSVPSKQVDKSSVEVNTILSAGDSNSHQSTQEEFIKKSDISNKEDSRKSTENSVCNESGDDMEPALNSTGTILNRRQYYTIPPLSELKLDDNGSCWVENFTIGRQGYGNITFLEPVDVAGLNLDEIVFISHKEVEVYPDEKSKPPVDQGLNTKALVTLDRVWPIDKTTRETIKDPIRIKQLNFESKLKKSCDKMKSQFVEYRPVTGSFLFEVNHFSKYGLIDDSDDDEVENEIVEHPLPGSVLLQSQIADMLKNSSSLKAMPIKITNNNQGLGWKEPSSYDSKQTAGWFINKTKSLLMDEDMFDQENNDFVDYEKFSISSKQRNLDNSLLKVQLDKFPVYMDEPDDVIADLNTFLPSDVPLFQPNAIEMADDWDQRITHQPFTPQLINLKLPRTSITTPQSTDVKTSKSGLDAEKYPVILKPKRIIVKHKKYAVPFEESILNEIKGHVNCDVALMKGCSYRVGWSNKLTIISLTNKMYHEGNNSSAVVKISQLFSGRKLFDYSQNYISVSKISISSDDYFKENVTNHLKICLEGSKVEFQDNVPLFVPKPGMNTLHEHCLLSQQIGSITDNYDRQVWELMVALWGNISNLRSEDSPYGHKSKMSRKSALSDWLENVVTSTAKKELDENDHVSSIVSLLSAHKILDACNLAISKKDYNLALLISQIGGNDIVRSRVLHQLHDWVKVEADYLIDHNRLKIMTLIAGQGFFMFNKGTMNTCENLDWKRAFALYLWYITAPSDSLIAALSEYEKAFSDEVNGVSYPDPPYADSVTFENTSGDNIQDLCYHLLKLYATRSHPLIKLLNVLTHTPNVLDYRLSWFIMVTLKSLGYQHLTDEQEAHFHINFATQLETKDMWHWAVFVLLHMADVNKRTKAVLDIIERNVELMPDHSAGLTETESFVRTNLFVPSEWIYSTKAILATSHKRYKEAAWYYIKAERWNEAHDIIMNYLLAGAVINDNYETIETLLGELILSEGIIFGWNYRGGLIWDYLNVSKHIQYLVKTEDPNILFHLEKLQPLMVSVCDNVNMLPTLTVKDRLCQAEISKRMMQFVRTLLAFQEQDSGISYRFIATLANKLPLPEDYVQQELLESIAHWINK